ncbi:MAG TPA: hypothetical protein VGR29_12890 [Thermomicrobiales bacterium]|nr:hypothetical protein [Thermomicrobiales bacterium]
MSRLTFLTVIVALVSSMLPRVAPALAQGDTADEQNAATAAYDISVLEAFSSYNAIYDRMHPDAQVFIPREAVVEWYENDFGPKQPQPITVTDVQMVEWVWPVTGKTYPYTAEVAFEQSFGDGTSITDVVRLVQDDAGSWRWFFGRSREFVDTQIARYADVESVAPTAPSSSAQSSAGSSRCELVELYPGYPGYRGYITGLVGPGDHECLSDLEQMDPSFSRETQDLENSLAASRLSISGPMNVWTWENWMAIEAERGLQPTCYSCLLVDASGRGPEPNGAFIDPSDSRLLIGTSLSRFTGDTSTSSRLLQDHFLSSGTDNYFAAQFEASVAKEQGLPADAHLRALASLVANRPHLNSYELLATYRELMQVLYTPGASGKFHNLNLDLLYQVLMGQGGYVPTPSTAHPNDQVFTIFLGFDALAPIMDSASYSAARSQLEVAADTWLIEVGTNPTLSFAAYLRSEGW